MTNRQIFASLYLKPKEERRILAGHLWVYSNEIDTARSALKNFTAGELVHIISSQNKILGIGYINPQTLLCVRLITRNLAEVIDKAFFEKHLSHALLLRQRIFTKPYYRLCYSESDLLPGLIVDRFADYYSVQVNTAGMERLIKYLVDALVGLLKPKGILLKNNSEARQLETLPDYQNVIYGEIPEKIIIEENGVKFYINLTDSQKTGWYYDQRDNRLKLKRYCENKTVLDAYSYTGSFAMYAAKFNASQITCIENSTPACAVIAQNMQLNNCVDKISIINDDAVEVMQTLREKQQLYDIVLIDPPAFIKKRKDIEAGMKKYFQINKLAIQLVKNQGLLLSSSCSMHLSGEELLKILRTIAIQQQKHLQILEYGFQACDHPIHPLIPETQYLKSILCRIYDPIHSIIPANAGIQKN